MSDEIKQPAAGEDHESWEVARAKFAKLPSGKQARKKRQKAMADAVDGRSLRATGRDQHLNFRASKAVRAALDAHVPKGKISLWLEGAILQKLRDEGFDI
jgi:hypothetical protein